MIADVHAGNMIGKKEFHKVVAKVNEMKPDIIFLVGGLVCLIYLSN